MADRTVVYADLSLHSQFNSARLPQSSRGSGVSWRSHWFWIALWIGWTGNIILVITVTVLHLSGTMDSQGNCHPKDEAENLTSSLQECSKKIAHLKSNLCETPSEASDCKLCPIKWLSRKGKCYWISDQRKKWSEANGSCSTKGAQMVVIQDLEEMQEFIQKNFQKEYSLWIGLNFVNRTKIWTWIDGTLLNYTMPQLSLSAFENTCGTISKDKGIHSEMCSDEFEWMCEKEAVVF